MKIALAQFNPTVGDFEGNAARILSLASQAKQRGAELAVFSELCICGYLPLDLLERPAFIERNFKPSENSPLRCLSPRSSAMPDKSIAKPIGQGSPSPIKPHSSPKAALSSSKAKCFCPLMTFSTNPATSSPATSNTSTAWRREQLGITVCEDAWNDKTFWANPLYSRDPVTELVAQGTSVLINISASPYIIDKRSLRYEMLRNIALRHNRPIIYVNQVGGDDSLIFDGASIAITADGEIAAQAKAFEEDLVLFDTVTGRGDIHDQPAEEIAYAYQALVTGTRDYVRKCRFSKAIVGLSGGWTPPLSPPSPSPHSAPPMSSVSPCPALTPLRAAKPTPDPWLRILASSSLPSPLVRSSNPIAQLLILCSPDVNPTPPKKTFKLAFAAII